MSVHRLVKAETQIMQAPMPCSIQMAHEQAAQMSYPQGQVMPASYSDLNGAYRRPYCASSPNL